MFEIININNAKKLMKKKNIIIYGTIHNCEEYFLNTFSNIELLVDCFNSICIIIVEYDSTDNTRKLLKEWMKINTKNILKHFILFDNLYKDFTLQSRRVAHCNNKILDYIFTKKLNNFYEYAIHCNFDNTVCSINFDGLCNCFQYDLSHWDVMTGVNNNDKYYDYSTLRCENTWFNKNIFSCEANNVNYKTQVATFLQILNDSNEPLKVQSYFNGFGIYNLEKLKNCHYDASYKCNICNGINQGCLENNIHVGLHKSMILKNCNIFINKNMQIQTFPKSKSISYEKFIKNMENKIPNVNKNVLPYLLINNLIDTSGLWLEFGTGNGFTTNQISHYTKNTLYSFDSFKTYPYKHSGIANSKLEFSCPEFLNENIKLVKGYFSITIPKFKTKVITTDKYISFLHIDCDIYQSACQIFDHLYNIIINNCIIVFGKFVNYPNYHLHVLKSFYEFVQKYEIAFEWIGINGIFSRTPPNIADGVQSPQKEEFSNYDNENVAVRIIENPYFNKMKFINNSHANNEDFLHFNWKKYISYYIDLRNITTKQDAWFHWKNNGIKEGRKYFHNDEKISIDDSFDWKKYVESYDDLSVLKTQEAAWNHWIEYGKSEGRKW